MTSQLASDTSVQKTLTGERSQSIRALTLAFCADPLFRYCYPDPQHYLEYFPGLVEAVGGRSYDCGRAFHDGDLLGTSLWLPPNICSDDEAVYGHVEKTVELRKVDTVFSILNHLGTSRPSEPHWHLALIGVDAAHQGQGLGSLLLHAMLDEIDREERLTYLVSTNPRCVGLFERFGFQKLGIIACGDAPPLLPMIREPKRVH
jgi:GNAT superfamily N-acetyltransferase